MLPNRRLSKAEQYAYRDRKQRKRQFRRCGFAVSVLGARANGLSYSRLPDSRANVEIDKVSGGSHLMNEEAGLYGCC